MENKYLQYFVEETNRRLMNIEGKIDLLVESKAESRVIKGIFLGAISFIVSLVVSLVVK